LKKRKRKNKNKKFTRWTGCGHRQPPSTFVFLYEKN
jgi:hypothetical protein